MKQIFSENLYLYLYYHHILYLRTNNLFLWFLLLHFYIHGNSMDWWIFFGFTQFCTYEILIVSVCIYISIGLGLCSVTSSTRHIEMWIRVQFWTCIRILACLVDTCPYPSMTSGIDHWTQTSP